MWVRWATPQLNLSTRWNQHQSCLSNMKSTDSPRHGTGSRLNKKVCPRKGNVKVKLPPKVLKVKYHHEFQRFRQEDLPQRWMLCREFKLSNVSSVVAVVVLHLASGQDPVYIVEVGPIRYIGTLEMKRRLYLAGCQQVVS